MRRHAIAPIAAGILLAVTGAAQAANKQTTFLVTANVASVCLVSATDLDFGAFDASADLTGSSSVNVRCTNGTGYTVQLGTGAGSFAQRTMSDGGSGILNYNLYTSTGYTTIWGDGTLSTSTLGGTGTGLSALKEVSYSVEGKLPIAGNEDAPVGSYGDTIQVTVEY
jgi:spore coat protein U-like protein